MSGADGNGTIVSYRWVTQVLIAIVGTLLLLGIGWIKSSQDALTDQMNNIPAKLQGINDSLGDLNGSVADIKGQMTNQESKINADHDLLMTLKAQTDVQQSWIGAHVHADKAERELHRDDK